MRTLLVIALMALAPSAVAQPGESPAAPVAPVAPAAPESPAAPAAPAAPAVARAPVATATASVTSLVFGDVLELRIEVVHDPDVVVNLPATLELGESFEEVGRRVRETVRADGAAVHEVVLELAAYRVGEREIPAIAVTAVVDGEAHTVETRAVPIRVDSFVGDAEDAQRRPNAGPVAVARRDWTAVWAAGVVLALALVALGAWRLARRASRWQRSAAHGPEAADRASPHEEALARLQQLEAAGALDAENLKPAYFAMSEILRDYLGRRFGFPGIDFTTDEVRRAMAARAEAEPIAGAVGEWLTAADFVKYARYPASADQARAALYQARQFVHESMPRLAPQEARRG